jgi:serine/threonine protein kinase
VRAANVVRAIGARWWRDEDNPAGPPSVRTGMIASGDKVIDDPDEAFFAAVRTAWPKLLAVEMEGAGVAAAVHEVQGHRAVGFVLVRGISDMPHRKTSGASASTQERDGWKVTASRNAARFFAHLVATAWPVPPRDDAAAAGVLAAAGNEATTGAASGSAAVARPPATPTPAYPNAEVQKLSERLRDAQARKETLCKAGLAPVEVDREILQLRRQLREGGQLRAGDTLRDGRYLLIKPVGRGGFAVVWEGHDTVEKRSVAIKVLHQHLAVDPQRRERFFRGARVMMDLQHPAVVRVYDPRGEDEAFSYFVMELVPGGNLRDAVLNRRVESERLLPLILQVGEALAEAHERRLVHRDVKPTNILLDEHGNAKLTDFDLVGAHDTTGGTRTGALGTVVYAAPECLDKPQEATARADVFGLGMTAIFCVLGRDLSMAVFRNPSATLAQLPCSPPARQVLACAVAWESDERFANAGIMATALREALDTSETTPPSLAVWELTDPLPSSQEPTSRVDQWQSSGTPSAGHSEPLRDRDDPDQSAQEGDRIEHQMGATIRPGPLLSAQYPSETGEFSVTSPLRVLFRLMTARATGYFWSRSARSRTRSTSATASPSTCRPTW